MEVKIYSEYIKQGYVPDVHELLSKVFDFSLETYEHSVDVAKRALSIGLYLNLPEESLVDLYTASLVHDVGKLKVPPELLNAGVLPPEKRKIIQSIHVNETNNILSERFPKEIVDIAYHHHEKLNGTGYPQGLKEEDLSISDKIITVADITSALALKRSYKEGLGYEKCEEILCDMATKGEIDKDITSIALYDLKNEKENANLEQDAIK